MVLREDTVPRAQARVVGAEVRVVLARDPALAGGAQLLSRNPVRRFAASVELEVVLFVACRQNAGTARNMPAPRGDVSVGCEPGTQTRPRIATVL